MSKAEAREPVEGDGYVVANLDGLGEGYGFPLHFVHRGRIAIMLNASSSGSEPAT